METHYWNCKNQAAISISENMFWADYAQYLVDQTQPMAIPRVVELQPKKPTNKLTCKKGHPVICWGTHAKPRKDENGKALPKKEHLQCDGCKRKFKMNQTYYSCAQSCDFDLCIKCSADPKGGILQK